MSIATLLHVYYYYSLPKSAEQILVLFACEVHVHASVFSYTLVTRKSIRIVRNTSIVHPSRLEISYPLAINQKTCLKNIM